MAWVRGPCPRGCGKTVSVTEDGRAPRHRCAEPKMGRRSPNWVCYTGKHTSRAKKEPRKCAKCGDTVYAFQDWLMGKHKPPKTEEERAADRVKLEAQKARIRLRLAG